MAINWKPAWLDALNSQKFFVSCSIHENAKKNEKNICCLDCCTSICPHCVSLHRTHRLLQVRRYVYHDVVRLEDLEKLIDCSSVQSYTINSSKVVFLKKRPQNRQFKGSVNICTSCDRCLQEPYIHCSLGCKVDYVLRILKKDLSPYLRKCKTLQLSSDFVIPHDVIDVEEANYETTHSTVVEGDEAMGSSDDSAENLSLPPPASKSCTDHHHHHKQIVRRKRSTGLYVCGRSASHVVTVSHEDMMIITSSSNMSRRKGVPQRSPLC